MRVMNIIIILLIIILNIQNINANNNNNNVLLFKNKDVRGWLYHRKAYDDEMINKVTFAVRHKNLNVLEEYFWAVSNPQSSLFGKYLNLQQVGEMVSNRDASIMIVGWLRQNGVNDIFITRNGEFIRATMKVAQAEKLFNTKLHVFKHPTLNHSIIRGVTADLPYAIHREVDFVSGVTNFPPSVHRPPAFISYDLLNNNENNLKSVPLTTPQLLKKYYNITMNEVANTKSTQSLFETLDQSFSPADLKQFQQQYNLDEVAMSKVIGPNNPSECSINPNNCGEANLDVQYMMAISQKAPTTFWSISDKSEQPYLDFVIAVSNDPDAPLVHSMSYGDIEKLDDPTMQTRFNTEVQKLGVRGITVVVSSGDDGVANFGIEKLVFLNQFMN